MHTKWSCAEWTASAQWAGDLHRSSCMPCMFDTTMRVAGTINRHWKLPNSIHTAHSSYERNKNFSFSSSRYIYYLAFASWRISFSNPFTYERRASITWFDISRLQKNYGFEYSVGNLRWCHFGIVEGDQTVHETQAARDESIAVERRMQNKSKLKNQMAFEHRMEIIRFLSICLYLC